MDTLRVAKAIIAVEEDMDFRSSEDPINHKWAVTPHKDSPCEKYPCSARAEADFGPLQKRRYVYHSN